MIFLYPYAGFYIRLHRGNDLRIRDTKTESLCYVVRHGEQNKWWSLYEPHRVFCFRWLFLNSRSVYSRRSCLMNWILRFLSLRSSKITGCLSVFICHEKSGVSRSFSGVHFTRNSSLWGIFGIIWPLVHFANWRLGWRERDRKGKGWEGARERAKLPYITVGLQKDTLRSSIKFDTTSLKLVFAMHKMLQQHALLVPTGKARHIRLRSR